MVAVSFRSGREYGGSIGLRTWVYSNIPPWGGRTRDTDGQVGACEDWAVSDFTLRVSAKIPTAELGLESLERSAWRDTHLQMDMHKKQTHQESHQPKPAYFCGRKKWGERMVTSLVSGESLGWPPSEGPWPLAGRHSRVSQSRGKADFFREIHTTQTKCGPSQKARDPGVQGG